MLHPTQQHKLTNMFDPNGGGFAHAGEEKILLTHNGVDIYGIVSIRIYPKTHSRSLQTLASHNVSHFLANLKYMFLAVAVFLQIIMAYRMIWIWWELHIQNSTFHPIFRRKM
jgi:hypothetical protein